MSNQLKVVYRDGGTLTGVAATDLKAGQLLAPVVGAAGRNFKVAVAAAGKPPIGVAGFDTVAGNVVPVVREGVVELAKPDGVAVGDAVTVGKDGAIAKAADGAAPIGVIVADHGQTVSVALSL